MAITAGNGADFLNTIFAELRAKIDESYDDYMAQHDEYLSSGLNKEEYTPKYGQIGNVIDMEGNSKYIWAVPKGRWFVHMVKDERRDDANNALFVYMMYDNYGCTYTRRIQYSYNGRNHIYTQLNVGGTFDDEARSAEGKYPLPNAVIDFVKRLPTDATMFPYVTCANIGALVKHYYAKFIEDLQRKKAFTEEDYKKAVQRAVDFEKAAVDYSEKVRELQRSGEEKDAKLKRSDDDLKMKNQQTVDLVAELERLHERLRGVDEESVRVLERERDELAGRVGDVERERDELRGRVGDVERERDELAGRVGDVERERDELAGRVAEAQARISEIENCATGVQEVVQEPAQEVTEVAIEEPIQEVTEVAIEEVAQEPAQEVTEEPVQEPAQE